MIVFVLHYRTSAYRCRHFVNWRTPIAVPASSIWNPQPLILKEGRHGDSLESWMTDSYGIDSERPRTTVGFVMSDDLSWSSNGDEVQKGRVRLYVDRSKCLSARHYSNHFSGKWCLCPICPSSPPFRGYQWEIYDIFVRDNRVNRSFAFVSRISLRSTYVFWSFSHYSSFVGARRLPVTVAFLTLPVRNQCHVQYTFLNQAKIYSYVYKNIFVVVLEYCRTPSAPVLCNRRSGDYDPRQLLKDWSGKLCRPSESLNLGR